MKRVAVLLAPLAVAAALLVPGTAAADVNDFTITDFSADYYLSNTDPQGEMRVVERLSVDFTDQNHGILRAIPDSYKGQSLQLHVNKVSSGSGAPAHYTTSSANGNVVLKIGDPNRTVTGAQEYTIDYTLHNVITQYSDHDELYWNVNGDQWLQPFDAVSVALHVPAGLQLWTQQPVCYTGSYGSTARDCTVAVTGDTVRASTTGPLGAGETLTLVAGFAKGYFHPATWQDRLRDYAAPAAELLVPVVLLGGAGFLWWWKRGRDAKGSGVIIPQYDAPDGLKPLEVGTVADFRVDNRDLTATIVDLAIRGYLRIIESDSKKLLGSRRSYNLQLLKQDWTGLNAWEQELLGGLFGAAGSTELVDLAAMTAKLQTHARNIRRSVEASLVGRGYFVSRPSKYLTLSLPTILFVIVIFGLNSPLALRGGLLVWGVLAGLATFGVFYHFLPARAAKGTAAKEHILGLKLYLEVAEKDRLAKLQSPEAPYGAKPAGPAHTVELFEKLLPYAIVLRVEQQWAKQFEHIYSSPPDWYGGGATGFSTGYLVGSLQSGFVSAMGASFASPRSSSGSGFGGGGFAGGGGGGGGGGGW